MEEAVDHRSVVSSLHGVRRHLAGASRSADGLRAEPEMGGCFSLKFFVPFARRDIYDELIVDPTERHPLGASPNVTFSMLRDGHDGDVVSAPAAVRAACAVLALARDPF
jgi:hypothetical protein